jgi:hypothetical protein
MNPQRWSAFGVRRRAYWSVFAGAFGHTYGANGVFQFHMADDPNPDWAPLDVWQVAIDYPGASDMGCLRRLMESRPLAGRAPRQDLILAGGTELVPRHIEATRGDDGAYAMVSVPQPRKTFTIDMDRLAGKRHRLWWFEPSTCEATLIGQFRRRDYDANGGLTLRTPANGQDWVLVIDRASAGFGPPGGPQAKSGIPAGAIDPPEVDELIDLLLAWGACPTPCPPCAADVDGDCVVDVEDLLALMLE